jgi:uncharacterized RDD family membrane protein YckC
MYKLTEIYTEQSGKKGKRNYQPVRMAEIKVRAKHYIIDWILIFLIGMMIIMLLNERAANDLFKSPFYKLIVLAFIGVYYFIFELAFQATPGKLFTKCMVVNEYGKRASVLQILGRSVIRLIPFEQFTFLGESSYGWHDRFPKTYVVEIKDLEWMLSRIHEQENENQQNYNALIEK